MQKILFSVIAFTLLSLVGCKKEQVISDVESLGEGSYVTLVRTNNNIFNYATINSASVGITVRQKGAAIDKIKVFVSPGAKSTNKSNWKFVKDVPYSGDSVNINVSSQELATALGVPVTGLQPGSSYTFYSQVITKDGRTFDIVNTPQHGITNYNMAMNWSAVVVCPFSPTGFPGNFRVIRDDWGDYNPGDIVTVDAATANSITMTVYPSPAYGSVNRKPITVNINPATGAATVTNQVYGDYPQFGIIDTRVNTQGSDNWVFSCTGTITLLLNHFGVSGGGNQGTYRIILQKI